MKQMIIVGVLLSLAAPAAGQDRDWKRVLIGAGVAAAGGYVLYSAAKADETACGSTFAGDGYLAQYNPFFPDYDPVRFMCRPRGRVAAGSLLIPAGAVLAVWLSKVDVQAGPRGVRLSRTFGW